MEGKLPSNFWGRSDAYEQYVGRWSRRVAPLFLDWLQPGPGLRWLDVGCGTGALCATILDTCAPAAISGVEPSAGFLETARQQLGNRATLYHASADAIPLPDASVDLVVCGLVLNFIPDLPAALTEMQRVTVSGGTIGGYVWDYAEKMELMRFFWDAAIEQVAGIQHLDEDLRFPLCRPEALSDVFTAANLDQVAVTAIDIPTLFTDFDDYWQPFLGGQGPAPAFVKSLDQAGQQRLRDRLRERLPQNPDGSISLIARAWAVRGRVAMKTA